MTIYNFSIDDFDNNKVIDQISLNTKIQIERLSLDREVPEKKLELSNPLDSSKNYLVLLDDKHLNKVVMSVPEGKEFNKPYPSEELKNRVKENQDKLKKEIGLDALIDIIEEEEKDIYDEKPLYENTGRKLK